MRKDRILKELAIIICSLLLSAPLAASNLTSLYSSLDPTSVAQHFAFYELYPDSPHGKLALQHAWKLLSGCGDHCDKEILLPSLDPQPIIALVNRAPNEAAPILGADELVWIEKLARHLPNRALKGSQVWSLEEVLQLSPEEIDLSRGLLLAEGTSEPRIRSYEATLDLMALQILARLPQDATPLQKVRAINDYIFSELRFRFPPHSIYAKEIDLYTLLPSVIDGRRGVCLGVSILYLSLAQRLNLPLQAITPPGHIYVRYESPEGEITNIETTARGIDIPSEMYLSVETRKLQKRNIKEVIGLAFMNQASVAWHKEDYKAAVALYEKGYLFLPGDPLLETFLGYQYLFIGEEAKGRALLEKQRNTIPDHVVAPDTVTEDFLAGKASAAAIQSIYREVDETRGSILKKQKELEEILKVYPSFRSAIFHLAVTHLQLGREKEAIPILERYAEMDGTNPVVCYYLAALYLQRLHYNAAWKYVARAESLLKQKEHEPRALEELKSSLQRACPKPRERA